MPVMNGIEAANAIKHAYINKFMKTIIVGLTGETQSNVNDACIEAGMSEVRMSICPHPR